MGEAAQGDGIGDRKMKANRQRKVAVLLGVSALLTGFFASVANAEETHPAQSQEKKRLLVLKIPSNDNLTAGEAEILEGLLCSGASMTGKYSVICAGNMQDMVQYNNFSQALGGTPCSKGLCMEALVGKYYPDFIIQTYVKKSGSNYEFNLKLLDEKGSSVLATIKRSINEKDPRFQAAIGEVVEAVMGYAKPAKEPDAKVVRDPPPDSQKELDGGQLKTQTSNEPAGGERDPSTVL